jgi:hypothetical protein
MPRQLVHHTRTPDTLRYCKCGKRLRARNHAAKTTRTGLCLSCFWKQFNADKKKKSKDLEVK